MAKLSQAGPLTATTEAVTAINPAMIMMAVALYSIEQQLNNIQETQNKILQLIEFEKNQL